jgi:aminomethyltransferase
MNTQFHDHLITGEPPATSRKRIVAQQAMRVKLLPGERLQIDSPDEGQCCELFMLDDGPGSARERLELGQATSGMPEVQAQLQQSRPSGDRLRQRLLAWGVKESHLQRGLHLDAEQLPCMIEATERTGAIQLVLAAPGADMMPQEQTTATELSVAFWRLPGEMIELPDPLSEPVQEVHVPHSSARVYRVKAGEWIQIIDVAGKQCSDFIAFDAEALERGEEITLDAVATRTLAGHALPQPGLYSRFADNRLQPMLELVQDTVGRHDSFLLACTPKYYEDSGYFGHVSCTDNFNRALREYGVAPRAGWPAINFFFNTLIEPCGTVGMDEPWSRPGDYVLLRANRDLICASSACPDDIDPANGWIPTDIHVRVYGAENQFERAIAHRVVPEELPRMTKQTAFHSRTSKLTKHFDEYRGYWVPTEFEGWGARAEYLACRESVAVMDLSPLRKFEVVGPDAEALLQYALTRNVRRLAVGEIVYSAACFETGGMVDDGTLFRMGEQAFRWVCGDPWSGTWLRELAAQRGDRVSIRESTDQLHNLAVQGPNSRALLSELVWQPENRTPVSELKWFHFTIGRLGGPEGIPLMVSRTGYTGELGFEVWCHPDDGAAVWDAIWQAGQPHGLAPLGFAALDMLRIEAGLIFAEHEFCNQTNPYEAGIGFTVPMKTKEEDFSGRAALQRQSPESRQKLVGLVLDGNEPVHHGDLVYDGRMPVGQITSATASPLLGKMIALCRVQPAWSEPGTRLEVGQLDGLQKRLPAQVQALPFHDPERIKVRS